MKVLKSQAVALMVACGLKNAAKMDNDQLADKLGGFPEKKLAGIKDKELKNLGKAVLTAIDEEKDITVVDDPKSKKAKAKAKVEDDEDEEETDDDEESTDDDDEESDEDEESDDEESTDDDEDSEEESDEEESDESDEDEDSDDEEESDEDDEEDEPVKKKKGKKGEKAEKGEKKKVKRESTVEKDWAGNRLGTRTHRINMAITEKIKSASQIATDAKATAIHSHLSKLKGLGYIENAKNKDGDKGFRLTKKGLALKGKTKKK
jgi:cobalamin biosynthesis protein CobT